VWFQKRSYYLPQGGYLKILRGRAVSKARIFKGKYEPRGMGGIQTKRYGYGGLWMFSTKTQSDFAFKMSICQTKYVTNCFIYFAI